MYPPRESVNVANNNATQAARVTRTPRAGYIGEAQQRPSGNPGATVLNQQGHVVSMRGSGNRMWGGNTGIQTTGRPTSFTDGDGTYQMVSPDARSAAVPRVTYSGIATGARSRSAQQGSTIRRELTPPPMDWAGAPENFHYWESPLRDQSPSLVESDEATTSSSPRESFIADPLVYEDHNIADSTPAPTDSISGHGTNVELADGGQETSSWERRQVETFFAPRDITSNHYSSHQAAQREAQPLGGRNNDSNRRDVYGASNTQHLSSPGGRRATSRPDLAQNLPGSAFASHRPSIAEQWGLAGVSFGSQQRADFVMGDMTAIWSGRHDNHFGPSAYARETLYVDPRRLFPPARQAQLDHDGSSTYFSDHTLQHIEQARLQRQQRKRKRGVASKAPERVDAGAENQATSSSQQRKYHDNDIESLLAAFQPLGMEDGEVAAHVIDEDVDEDEDPIRLVCRDINDLIKRMRVKTTPLWSELMEFGFSEWKQVSVGMVREYGHGNCSGDLAEVWDERFNRWVENMVGRVKSVGSDRGWAEEKTARAVDILRVALHDDGEEEEGGYLDEGEEEAAYLCAEMAEHARKRIRRSSL